MDDNPAVTALPFASLANIQQLQIANTSFTDWPTLPDTLRSLRLRDVGFSLDGGAIAILAHYPSLRTINGSTVTNDQPSQAARWAIRAGVRVADWQAAYPRLHASTATCGTTAMAHNIVSVQLVSLAAASCTQPPLTLRLPLSLAVRDVEKLCMRHFGVEEPVLQWSLTEDKQKSLPVDLPSSSMSLMDVPDGATIWVQDVAEERSKEAVSGAENDDWQRRIEVQENERKSFMEPVGVTCC